MAKKTGFQSRVIQKTKIIVIDAAWFTHSIIMYGLRVKWNNPGKRVTSSQHRDVVAIEKVNFGSPSTTVAKVYVYTYAFFFKLNNI